MSSLYLKKGTETKRDRVTPEFKEKFPDLFKAVYDEGFQAGQNSVNFQVDEKHLNSIRNGLTKLVDPDLKNENLSVADRAKKAWDADFEIRKEFSGDFESYLAYETANAKGQVKILGA